MLQGLKPAACAAVRLGAPFTQHPPSLLLVGSKGFFTQHLQLDGYEFSMASSHGFRHPSTPSHQEAGVACWGPTKAWG